MKILCGQNAVFSKNPIFLNFNPQNDLQKCNSLLSTTWMHSNANTMLLYTFSIQKSYFKT